MELLIIGVALGAVVGATLCIFIKSDKEDDPREWHDLLSEQQGHIAELRQHTQPKPSFTHLTSRPRTLQ